MNNNEAMKEKDAMTNGEALEILTGVAYEIPFNSRTKAAVLKGIDALKKIEKYEEICEYEEIDRFLDDLMMLSL